MNKLQSMREEAEVKFGEDPNHLAIASRALDFLEEWSDSSEYQDRDLDKVSRLVYRRHCAAFVKAGLQRAREEEYGFLGALLTAIAFQLAVQLIVRWIMKKFFE